MVQKKKAKKKKKRPEQNSTIETSGAKPEGPSTNDILKNFLRKRLCLILDLPKLSLEGRIYS